jgi:hypothetical protein
VIAAVLVIVLGTALWIASLPGRAVEQETRAAPIAEPRAAAPPSEEPAPAEAPAEPSGPSPEAVIGVGAPAAAARASPGARAGSKTAPRVDSAPSGPPGTVNVAAVGGWADIVVDGRRRGRTPAQFELPPGRHVIELRPFGEGPPRRRQIRVRAGETERVVVEL